MVKRKKLLDLNTMAAIAQTATRDALSLCKPVPLEDRAQWALGEFLTDDNGIFEIYIPNDNPVEAIVISRAVVSRTTGEVTVETFLDKA